MAADVPPIGRLRWLVTISTRVQTPDAQTDAVDEAFVPIATVHADVQPIGALTFWSAQQTDTPVTHLITMRWQPYLDNTVAIQRTATLPGGATRTETFRVRRIKELAGRKRHVMIEAELEHSAATPPPLLSEAGAVLTNEQGAPLLSDGVQAFS